MGDRHEAEDSIENARERMTELAEELSYRATPTYIKERAKEATMLKARELKVRAGASPVLLATIGGLAGAWIGSMLGKRGRARLGYAGGGYGYESVGWQGQGGRWNAVEGAWPESYGTGYQGTSYEGSYQGGQGIQGTQGTSYPPTYGTGVSGSTGGSIGTTQGSYAGGTSGDLGYGMQGYASTYGSQATSGTIRTGEEIEGRYPPIDESSPSLKEKAANLKGRVADRAANLKDRAADKLHHAKERVSDRAHVARERGSDAMQGLKTKASHVRERVPEMTHRAGAWIEETSYERPMLLAIGAGLLGLIAGLAIPVSRKERELLGPAKWRMREGLHELGSNLEGRIGGEEPQGPQGYPSTQGYGASYTGGATYSATTHGGTGVGSIGSSTSGITGSGSSDLSGRDLSGGPLGATGPGSIGSATGNAPITRSGYAESQYASKEPPTTPSTLGSGTKIDDLGSKKPGGSGTGSTGGTL